MKKIIYITSTLKKCAPTTQLHYILKSLDRRHFDPCIVTLSPEPVDSARSVFCNLDLEIITLGLSRLRSLSHGVMVFRQAIKDIKPDLIHSSGFRSDIMASGVSDLIPTVATVRNYPLHDYPMKYGRLTGGWMAWKHCRALFGIRVVVPCSYAIADLLHETGIDFHVIQDGIDTDYFHPVPQSVRDALRRDWGGGADARVFVTAGSLIARKDPLTLVRGFLQSPLAAKDYLYILGDGPLKSACLKEIGRHKNVRLLGHIEDVRPFFQGADCYVSASHSEGLPNSVLEALCCGLPVVLSDIAPHREQLERAPQIGEFFPVGDVAEFGACLERLVASDRSARSEAAVSLVNRHFSAREMSLAYQSLYTDLLGGE